MPRAAAFVPPPRGPGGRGGAPPATGAAIGDDSDVGPYAHVRDGCRIGQHVHIGTSAELKNSVLDDHAKAGHFSYLGDATVGQNVNIGAGTITANYDGKAKHATTIGNRHGCSPRGWRRGDDRSRLCCDARRCVRNHGYRCSGTSLRAGGDHAFRACPGQPRRTGEGVGCPER